MCYLMGGPLNVQLCLSDLVTQAGIYMELNIIGWNDTILGLHKKEMLENSVGIVDCKNNNNKIVISARVDGNPDTANICLKSWVL